MPWLFDAAHFHGYTYWRVTHVAEAVAADVEVMEMDGGLGDSQCIVMRKTQFHGR
jgi:hypothetical protein